MVTPPRDMNGVWSVRTEAFVAGHVSCFQEGRKELFYLTTHSTHFIYGYMVNVHSDFEGGNQLPPHGLLFPISSHCSTTGITKAVECIIMSVV